ncbi:MAG: AAA domain-containing protein [Clostridium sp.]|nr:AAA domain-containing protein [Clostridium sp.]MCH3963312.1 AAA domain-containing protein [Clostridium sp.]MCI1717247.1 AAA domain-containing protein [Clostridium sp.]MCI1801587.1 AAA domain-containing protein [Clostridium sp.]MCI1815433.1 AAA domain-containing protein [Clostridium sp.]
MSEDKMNSVFDYYIDYEFETRMMDNSIKGKGKDEPISILKDVNKIKGIINSKKAEAIYNKLKNQKSIKESSSKDKVKHVYSKIKYMLENKLELNDFVDEFDFDNKDKLVVEIQAIKEDNRITVCYPLIERSGKTRIKKPVVTFNCTIAENNLKVDKYCVNKDSLLTILAYAQDISRGEFELAVGNIFKSTYEKINSFDGQDSIHEILKLVDDEVFASFNNNKIKSILDFNRYEYWEKLNRVFITLEELDELKSPIFRDELKVCKDKYLKGKDVPSVLEKYIFGNSNAIEYESIKDKFKFHYGSYTDKYPINEKQWDIVKISDYNELISVNGPPGTGKTTLLKELIADNIVKKTKSLVDVWNKKWTKCSNGVLISPLGGKNKRSIVVTSTNNLAVDNIGLELLKEIPYFTDLAEDIKDDYKGIICARLGKYANLECFYNEQFNKLIESLENIRKTTFDETSVEKFKILWDKLGKIKKDISTFYDERNKLYELLGVKDINNDLLNKNENVYKERLIEQKGIIDNISIEEDKVKENIHNVDHEIEKCKKLKDKYNGDKSIEKDNNRNLFKTLEEYRKKSVNGFIKKIMLFISNEWKNFFENYPSEEYIRNEIDKSDKKLERLEMEIDKLASNIDSNENEYKKLIEMESVFPSKIKEAENLSIDLSKKIEIINSFKKICKNLELTLKMDDLSSRSLYNVSNCSELLKMRKNIFDTSLKVMQLYIVENRESIANNLGIILQKNGQMFRWCKPFYSSKDEYWGQHKVGIFALWETFFMCFPVITTTLHSFRKDMIQMIPNLIDLIMVDEAAQILPHYLCAPLYRTSRSIIVGDTNQLEPIRLLKNDLIENSGVDEDLRKDICIENNSAQDYADRNCDVFEKLKNKRTGIILNEHRRCEESIIKFSNKFVYHDKLIVTNKDNNEKLFGNNLIAFDVRGIKGEQHFNNLEISACKKIVEEYKNSYGHEVVKRIAIISPFNKQVRQLKNEIHEVEIGTVHTFQGRQKDVIIFTTVIDDVRGNKAGLSNFIGAKGNLLNVAFSRAIKQFIMVGNLKAIGEGSYFLKKALDTIMKNGKIYSFFNMTFDKQSEKDIENWEKAFDVLSGGNTNIHIHNMELINFLKIHCPKNIVVGSAAHYEILKEIIRLANKSIYIFSPWISDYVVDYKFLRLVISAIRKGVKIYICFGYKGKNISLDSKENIKDVLIENGGFYYDIEKITESIFYMKEKLGVKIVYSPPVHTKLLLIDDVYMLIGSHNWLLNSGKGRNDNYKEMSCLVKSTDSIEYVKDRYINNFL